MARIQVEPTKATIEGENLMRLRNLITPLFLVSVGMSQGAMANTALQGFVQEDGTHTFRFVMPEKLTKLDKEIAEGMGLSDEAYRKYKISIALYDARWCLNGWSIDSSKTMTKSRIIEGTCAN